MLLSPSYVGQDWGPRGVGQRGVILPVHLQTPISDLQQPPPLLFHPILRPLPLPPPPWLHLPPLSPPPQHLPLATLIHPYPLTPVPKIVQALLLPPLLPLNPLRFCPHYVRWPVQKV